MFTLVIIREIENVRVCRLKMSRYVKNQGSEMLLCQ